MRQAMPLLCMPWPQRLEPVIRLLYLVLAKKHVAQSLDVSAKSRSYDVQSNVITRLGIAKI